MRWFINSTKETARIPKADAVQSQIDTMVNEMNHINDMVHDIKNSAITRSNTIHDAMQQKAIQINSILWHQGNHEKKIDELTKRVKELENLYMPKQANGNKKPKFRRIANSYADHKFDKVFQIAMGYSATGMKQKEIAGRLNSMNIKTATGSEFDQKSVSKLLQNQIQKARFMKGKERKPKL